MLCYRIVVASLTATFRLGKTMKRLSVVLVGLCLVAPAFGVQEVTLRDQPPLQPLHWCQHSDGQVAAQSEPCASDTTEVSSVSRRNADGTLTHFPLGSKEAVELGDTRPAQNTDSKSPPLDDFPKRMGKWLGFAIVVGLVAKFLKQSFVLWLILGFVLRMILVALNIMAF
jgi:hypothetical protein